jgi:predicted PhzF superfamily epimerase YddE/YHI9
VKCSIAHVDAFADRPFAGNPAAVCVLERPAAEEWMQNIAREMNLSETAFLYPEKDGYNLRWFGPVEEVDLCGHATIASAHVLWESLRAPMDRPLTFYSRSGILLAHREPPWIMLDFPMEAARPLETPDLICTAFGCRPLFFGENRVDYMIEVESEKVLRALTPDFSKLKDFSGRGYIVTSRSETAGFDYVTRFFAPGRGVNEDPVTGSAQCCLGPYWREKLHRDDFVSYQASWRGGILRVKVRDPRVIIGGKAVTIFLGELLA